MRRFVYRPVVYVMKDFGGKGLYKIGFSRCIEKRYMAKRTHDQVIFKIDDDCPFFNLENAIHHIFRGRRVSDSEVFRLTKGDLAVLEKISRSKIPWKTVMEMVG